jgi:arsenate reductase
MKKIYYLATCDTCKRIINDVGLPNAFEKQDIKQSEITVKQLEELAEMSGSYESLFSKRAKLYKERGLKDDVLLERDFKRLILEHYTFLQRPVIVNNNEIFIGNSKKTVEAAKASINKKQ